jgi:tRNA U34 2-thiouridine synthase MnmA/TrmU
MRAIGARFLFTGEVLGQRPMSQHKRAMDIIENESGFEGFLLRPLSAAMFKPSIPEKEGWVDRNILLGISGRSRKTQISLAAEKGINDYPCPAGGCLLTDKNFSDKLRDYFRFTERPSIRDISLLKVGRHFRLENGDKVIVARNEDEYKIMKNLCRENEHLLVPQNFRGPAVILQGYSIKSAVEKMLQYTKKSLPEEAFVSHLHKQKAQILSLREI